MGEIVNQKPGPIPVGSTAKEIALSVERKVPQESEKSGKHEDTFLDDQVSKSTLSTKKASVTVEEKNLSSKVKGQSVEAQDDDNKKRDAVEQEDQSKCVQSDDQEQEKDLPGLSSEDTHQQEQLPDRMPEGLKDEGACAPPNTGTGKVEEEETHPIASASNNNNTVIIFNSTTKHFEYVSNEIKDPKVSRSAAECMIEDWIVSDELT